MNESAVVASIIDHIRTNLGALRSPFFVNSHIFEKTTQASVFLFTEPSISLIIFRSDSAQADKAIRILRNLPLKRAIESFDTINVTDGSHPADEEIILDFFRSLGAKIAKQKTEFSLRIWDNAAVLVVHASPVAIALQDITSSLLSYQRFEPPDSHYFAHTGIARTVHFGRFPQDVIIGEPPTRTFAEKLDELWATNQSLDISHPATKGRIANTEIVCFRSGVVVADTAQQDSALNAINLLFGVLNWHGLLCTQVTIVELGTAEIDCHGAARTWSYNPQRVRNAQAKTTVISESSVRSALLYADRLSADEEIARLVRLKHSAWDHFMGGEMLQCFVLEWTTVEKLLSRMWQKHVSSKLETTKRREALTKNKDITISIVIEFLALAGAISDDIYSKAHAMRVIRNKVIHDGRIPTRENASDCCELGASLLRAEIARVLNNNTELETQAK